MQIRKILLASMCLALNVVLAKLAATLTLPVYLDTVGTILSAVLLPWWMTLIVGALTSVFGSIVIHPAFLFYVGTQVSLGTMAILLARVGMFKKWFLSILAGVAMGIVAAVVSAPVTVVVFGGVTLSGTTAINAILLASGKKLWESVLAGSLLIELLDKPAAAFIAHMVWKRMPLVQSKSPTASK